MRKESLIDTYIADPKLGYLDLARKEHEMASSQQDRWEATGRKDYRIRAAARLHLFKGKGFQLAAAGDESERLLRRLNDAISDMYSEEASDAVNGRKFALLAGMVAQGVFLPEHCRAAEGDENHGG